MKFSVLGSGSKGNATLVLSGETRVLIDAGFSGKDLARRLETIQIDPDSLDGIVISHDHSDHTRGMGVYARRHGTPLHLTPPTLRACQKLLKGQESISTYEAGRHFRIGGLRIEPFVTVHDAADPVGLAVVEEATGLRLGIATDLGRPTAGIRHALTGCDVLVLESNHDEGLLQKAPYPWSVKARIRSSHGHLSNEGAARFALELMHPGLKAVVLAHLSYESNRPTLALEIVGKALRKAGFKGWIEVADQDEPMPIVDVLELAGRNAGGQLTLL